MAKPTTSQRPSTPSRAAASTAQHPFKVWLLNHLYVFFSSLGQLSRTPIATLMTASVIGIALALPAGLYLLLENALQISQSWDGSARISVFLNININDEQADSLATQWRERADIADINVISREAALKEYRQLSGFTEALDALDDNPLPAVLVVTPASTSAQAVQALQQSLNELPEADVAQFDMRWLQRLFAIVEIIQRGVVILAGILAIAVLLIIGNTIRLSINNSRQEIEVNKLFGATDPFIRRPFLYNGLWYGLLGGLVAWLLVFIAFYLLQAPAKQLALLYYSQYTLIGPDALMGLSIVAAGGLLGLLGAWLAVGRHLRDFRP